MKKEHIRKFLNLCGVSDKQMSHDRDWINSKCVFQHWFHKGGKDTRPSFGIKINDNGPSTYFCFSCSSDPAPLARIIHTFWVLTKEYPWDIADFFLRHEIFTEEVEQPDTFNYDVWANFKPEAEIYPLPQEVLDRYPLICDSRNPFAEMCLAYLVCDRGINPDLTAVARLRFDADNNAIIYPLATRTGGIYGLQARNIFQKALWTITPEKAGFPDLKFFSPKYSGAVFGIEDFDIKKPLMVVEGAEDCLRLKSLGYHNVVATMTSSFSKKQFDTLMNSYLLVVGYDDDAAGQRSFLKLHQLAGKSANIFRVHWSHAGNGKSGKLCTDAGDLVSKDQLFTVLEKMTTKIQDAN